MKTKTHRKGILLASLLLGGWMMGTTPLAAQEREERRAGGPPRQEREVRRDGPDAQKMRESIREIARLRESGNHEEARKMAERVREEMTQLRRQPRMMGQAGRPQGPAAGRGMPPREGPPMRRAETPREKVRHLGAAAGHLRAAGYEKQAAEAGKEMERIIADARRESEKQAKMKEAEAKAAKEKAAAAEAKAAKEKEAKKAKDAKKAKEAKEAKEAKAKKDVEKAADKPSPDAMRDEMNKMRREMEQLRRELREAKAGAQSRPERPDRPDRGPREGDRPR